MAESSRSFWIYQAESVPVPWAMCIEKVWDRRKPRDALLTVMIYSENIDNPMHCTTLYDLKFDTVNEYLEVIENALSSFTSVSKRDRTQLEVNLLDILTDNSLFNRR